MLYLVCLENTEEDRQPGEPVGPYLAVAYDCPCCGEMNVFNRQVPSDLLYGGAFPCGECGAPLLCGFDGDVYPREVIESQFYEVA